MLKIRQHRRVAELKGVGKVNFYLESLEYFSVQVNQIKIENWEMYKSENSYFFRTKNLLVLLQFCN